MKPIRSAAATVALALLAACGDDDVTTTTATTAAPAASTSPSLSIAAPPPGTVVKGNVVSLDDPVVLSGLEIGRRRLSVVIGDGTHTRLGSTVAETTVDVQGPSIDASAPATSVAGQPVVSTVKVDGLTLVKADGNTSGATGHLGATMPAW